MAKEYRDEEINDPVRGKERMKGISGGVLRTAVTQATRAHKAFTGDFTGDGVASGRWKGKGVDRRYRREIGGNDVMGSIGREVVELSD
ncbi:hypothetical protein BCON_0055g00370 [Botryotinia convoluta]|uniref:Uncharacterized protein n=1 Tax=Botryotinia convoluta TaxID=54673 RepID=A0A4Z1ICU6_9HELO|nr:hypothetical protein BCON_0055g00370 [Botryotinia convoluta]